MAAEANLNARLIEALADFDPVRVENPACPGTPDINYTYGWIESKVIPRFPQEGVVKVPHYTPQQRVWHTKRIRAGGVVYVVIQVGKEVFVFRGNEAAHGLGKIWGRPMFYGDALARWEVGQRGWQKVFLDAIVTE